MSKYIVIQYKSGREAKIPFDTKEEAEAFKKECLEKYPNICIEIKEAE